jgi:UDP-N-acetyl-D-glucosamine dehydrogenase
MPRYWVQQVQDKLNDAGKAVKGSQILVLGVAYKKDVSDIRESPALDIIHLLEEKGANVSYHDPHVPAFHHEGMEMVGVTDLDLALRLDEPIFRLCRGRYPQNWDAPKQAVYRCR